MLPVPALSTALTRPYLIVGAGLAGIHLAWEFYRRGIPFRIAVADTGLPAWKASAGIINPVTGKRIVRSWAIDRLLPAVHASYSAIAQILEEECFFQSRPLFRFFRHSEDPSILAERMKDPAFSPFVISTAPEGSSPRFQEENPRSAGFSVHGAGWVDVTRFITRSRVFFATHGLSLDGIIDSPAQHPERMEWSAIIFCEGADGACNPWFDWLDYRLSAGDVIDLALPSPQTPVDTTILNWDKWLLRLSASHVRIGSTYRWDDLDLAPAESVAGVLFAEAVCRDASLADAQIVNHRVGVRPGTNDSRPYIGQHPIHPKFLIFNGLGSKGASQAPYCASALADYLQTGKAIPGDIDVARRLKFARGRLDS